MTVTVKIGKPYREWEKRLKKRKQKKWEHYNDDYICFILEEISLIE